MNKTFETGKIVEPPERKIEPPRKPKKVRAKKPTVEGETGEEAAEATQTTVKVEELEHELHIQPGDAGPPSPLPAKKVPGMRSKVKEVADKAVEVVPAALKKEEVEDDGAIKPKDTAALAAKPKAKKSRAKKRPINEVDASSEEEPEYIPKKSRSRSIPFKGATGLA